MINISITGLKQLSKQMKDAPAELDKQVHLALGKALLMVQGEAQRRAPHDTGILESSIGGRGGYSRVDGWKASLGTNVKYAFIQEVSDKFHHKGKGEAHYMEKGTKAAEPFIVGLIEKVCVDVAKFITK